MLNFSIHSLTAVSALGALFRPRIAAGVRLILLISQTRSRAGFLAMPELCGSQVWNSTPSGLRHLPIGGSGFEGARLDCLGARRACSVIQGSCSPSRGP